MKLLRTSLLALSSLLLARSASAAPVYTLDLRSLYGVAPSSVDERRAAYDTLAAATCVQGLANRDAPNLYLFYTLSVAQAGLDTDQLWFDRLADPAVGGGVIAGRPVQALTDLDAAIEAFSPRIKGLAVWDEMVPATVNAAFAAAGADDLIVVRHDPSPASLFSKLSGKLPVVVWLVNSDGSSRFLDKQGQGVVPDTQRQTSQSAKADAHVWVLEKYLKPGKLDPTEFGWMLDGFWVQKPQDYAGNINATHQLQITNRDWLVARRGAPFDLSPWSDVAATDDPSQPVGTDPAVLTEWMSTARAQSQEVISIRGFFGWQFKYTTLEGLPEGHEPVMGEWTGVKLVSPFAAGLDADAPGLATMANASFYAHVPLDDVPAPQRRPTAEDLIGNGLLRGLASNGGFEDGEEGWSVQLTNHVVYSDPDKGAPLSRTGMRFLQCNTSSPGDAGQDQLFREGAPVGPGQRVTLRGFVRAMGGPVSGVFAVDALGGAQEHAEVAFTAGPSWSEVRVTLDAQQGGHSATRGTIRLASAGVNLDLDDVAFYAGDPAEAKVEAASYVLWFAGDWDAASWMYGFSPGVWDAEGRGLVPLAWDFAGHVATRFPPFFRHALATRTGRDFFIGADSGAGYGNPSQMGDSARATWRRASAAASRRTDASALWVLDPLAPIDATHLDAVSPASGDGVVLTSSGLPTPSLVGSAPVDALIGLGGNNPTESAAWVLNDAPAPAGSPVFRAYRAVLWKPLDMVSLSRKLSLDHPERRFRVVDPFSYFYLLRRHLGGANTHRASFTLSPPTGAAGAPTPVSFRVRNDGWNTWKASGENLVRVGFHVATASPAPGSLPTDPAGYPVRVSLPADVPPGGEVDLVATLPPVAAGSYFVQADVVEEGVSWFESRGDLPIQFRLAVTGAGQGGAGQAGSGQAGSAQAGSGQAGSGQAGSGQGGAGGAQAGQAGGAQAGQGAGGAAQAGQGGAPSGAAGQGGSMYGGSGGSLQGAGKAGAGQGGKGVGKGGSGVAGPEASGGEEAADGGCGCRAAGGARAGGWPWVLALAAAALRRKRRDVAAMGGGAG